MQGTGSFIRSARKAKGLTLKQVAEALGVTESAVSRWETEKTRPADDAKLAVARYLDLDPVIWFGGAA